MQVTLEIPTAALDAAISERVALLTARLAPAFPVPATRPHFANANPGLALFHRALQREMFGAVKEAGLDREDREGMIAAVNLALGLNLTSRTQMTPMEMAIFTVSLQMGTWAPGWVMRHG